MDKLTSRQKAQKNREVRNELIRKDFDTMSNKRQHGVKVYTKDIILARLGMKYFLAPKTIEDIVFNRQTKKK